jgi:glutathione synthase/RimK-type ligase-like ATP-grasp enzyme
MKHVAIAYGYYKSRWIGHRTDDLFGLLSSAIAENGAQATKVGLLDMAVWVENNSLKVVDLANNKDMLDYETLYMANWRKGPEFALAVSQYMLRNERRVVTGELSRYLPMTKLGELVYMSDKNIPLPRSLVMRIKHWKKAIRDKQDPPFGYPFVLKAINGSMGANNFLIKNRKDLKDVLSGDPEVLYVAQEFIPNDRDYRLIVMGGEVKIVIMRKRKSADTHLNNTSAGAEGTFLELDDVSDEMKLLAVRAADAVGRTEFAGVDIIVDSENGSMYVLEVNKSPQIETGSNVEKKIQAMAQYLAGSE